MEDIHYKLIEDKTVKLFVPTKTPKQIELVEDIVNSSAKFFVINGARQSSKSETLAFLIIHFGWLVQDNIMVVSPTYSQSQVLFEKVISKKGVFSIFENVKSSKPYEITTITGSKISFRSADRPDSLRGSSNKIVIIDEMAFIKQGVFQTVIRPTTAAKANSKVIIASTPNGVTNDFYNLYQLANSGDPKYKYYFISHRDNPYYDRQEVEDARKRLPSEIFSQEYEGVFLEGGGEVFENVKDVMVLSIYKGYNPNERYYAGIDFGSRRDQTVLTILNSKKETAFMQSYSGDWGKQIHSISEVLKQYNPIVYGEVNSIGDVLVNQLKRTYGNVHEFVMSNSSKREIIEKLKYDIVNKSISLPTVDLNIDLYEQLINYTFSLSATGLIRYHHKTEELKDDRVDSLAIANYCYDKHNVGFKIHDYGNHSGFYDSKYEDEDIWN